MIRTFIQVTALLLTMGAAVFLAKGSLGLSVRVIAELASTKFDANLDMVSNLASQRADSWIGVFLLLAALVLQMANTLWPIRWNDFSVHRGAAIYAGMLCLVVLVGCYFLSWEIASSTRRSVEAELGEMAVPSVTDPSTERK